MTTAGGGKDAEVETEKRRSLGGKSWFCSAPLLRQQPFHPPTNNVINHFVPAATLPLQLPPPFRLDLHAWFFLAGAEIMDPPISPSELTMEPAAISDILASGGPDSPKQPPPTEHIRSMPNTTTADESKAASLLEDTDPKHDSAIEFSGDARKLKRMSASLPFQPSALGIEPAPSGGRRASPSLLFDPTFNFPAPPVRPLASAQSSPVDNTFLTALAAQERRVLELKEELQRAEQELDKLKKQWTAQENAKKRQSAHRTQALRPVSIDLGSGLDGNVVDDSSASIQKELEKRKTITNVSRPTHRRVFSGSRHTRALSLLSPEKMNQTFSQTSQSSSQFSSQTEQPRSSATSQPRRPTLISRLNTAPDLLEQIRNTNTMDDITSPISDTSKEGFRISRQMATDFKDGLWTFFEDLRQATVGDEGIVGPPPKPGKSIMKPPSKPSRNNEALHNIPARTSSRSHRRQKTPDRPARPASMSNISPKATFKKSPARSRPAVPRRQSTDLWNKENPKQPCSASPHPKITGLRKKSTGPDKPIQHTPLDIEEPWDTWDTPEKRVTFSHASSNASQTSAASPSTAATSPVSASEAPQQNPASRSAKEMSTPTTGKRVPKADGGAKRDPIPWPALHKLAPGNLKRTASNLMSEWEKSVTPPPSVERKGSREDYLSWPSPMNP